MNFSYLRIFKCIRFVSNHYISDINLDVALSFHVFNEFDFIYQLDVLVV